MSGRKRWIFAVLMLALMAALIGLIRGPTATFSARVAVYDPIARSAGIVISNTTDSGLEYGCWQKDANTAHRYGHLDPHEAMQVAFLVDRDYPPEVYIEGTPAIRHSRIWHLSSLLKRIGINAVPISAVSVSLTNCSGWVRSGR